MVRQFALAMYTAPCPLMEPAMSNVFNTALCINNGHIVHLVPAVRGSAVEIGTIFLWLVVLCT